MKKIIETERLYLRALTIKDAESLFRLNLDKNVMQYTGEKAFENSEEAKYFLGNYDQYEKYGLGRWAVIDKKNETFLGWCGIKYTETSKEYDIGFRFFKKYWNNGYATEASKACLNYGINELKINDILGRAMKENGSSINVLKKIGLEFDKEFDFEGNIGVIYKTKR